MSGEDVVARRLQPSGAAIVVVKPGMLTTIQDEGRWGLQARGVPVAGPMDPASHRLANALVGNDRGAAILALAFFCKQTGIFYVVLGGVVVAAVRWRRAPTIR